MLERINQVKGIGLLHDADGKPIGLQKASFIYAGNRCGKSTSVSLFQSCSTNNPAIILSRRAIDGNHDPEETFVVSLSSCNMLWFLSIAAKEGFSVKSYTDESSGIMGKNDEGKVAMLSVTLRPEVKFTGANQPSFDVIKSMHEAAHAECFIASSVKTKILCEPVFA